MEGASKFPGVPSPVSKLSLTGSGVRQSFTRLALPFLPLTDCSICSTDYTESLGFTCTACSNHQGGLAVMFVVIGLFVLAGVGGLLYMV